MLWNPTQAHFDNRNVTNFPVVSSVKLKTHNQNDTLKGYKSANISINVGRKAWIPVIKHKLTELTKHKDLGV